MNLYFYFLLSKGDINIYYAEQYNKFLVLLCPFKDSHLAKELAPTLQFFTRYYINNSVQITSDTFLTPAFENADILIVDEKSSKRFRLSELEAVNECQIYKSIAELIRDFKNSAFKK